MKKITNIDEVFHYLEDNDYLELQNYIIRNYDSHSDTVEVQLENEEANITFVFKDIINTTCHVCWIGDNFELSHMIFQEMMNDNEFVCEFADDVQEISVRFKKIELIIENN